MSFESHRTHSYPLFHKYSILKFFDMIQSQNILFIHKLLYKNVPSDLHNTFTLLSSDFSYNIARNKNYITFTKPVNTQSFGTYSIKFQCKQF